MSAKVCDGQQWRTWRKTWPRAKRWAARRRRRAEEIVIEPERTIFELTDRVARLEKSLAAAEDRLRALEPCVNAGPNRATLGHFGVIKDGIERCRDCGVRIWPPPDEEER